MPINEKFKALKIVDKSSIPNLVLVLNRAGDIRKGNVVLFRPDNQPLCAEVPDNTFHDILNKGTVTTNGLFQFLGVAGQWKYQLDYKNGKLYSFGLVEQKDKPVNAAGRIDEIVCIDWYLVTTYYYEDGTTSQTSEYLGTTCNGECGNPMYQSLCPDGSSSSNDYEYETARDRAWHVASTIGDSLNPTGAGYGINAIERFRGKRISSEPQGGHFTSIVHIGSECNGGCTYGQFGYGEDSWEGSAINQTASSRVKGHYPRPSNGETIFVDNSKTWSFQTIFP